MAGLSGGEKSKIRRLVVAINKKYPQILDILELPNLRENEEQLIVLSGIVKEIFKWTSNLSFLLVNNNEVLRRGFDTMQEANRKRTIDPKNMYEVDKLLDAVDSIYDMQKEYIRIVDEDSNSSKDVLKQIMDELGIEAPRSKSDSLSGGSKHYTSIDDLFADLED